MLARPRAVCGVAFFANSYRYWLQNAPCSPSRSALHPLAKAAGKRLGAGAAIGGALGLGLDVALAGLSLGAATSVGAALGGVAAQGFDAMGRSLSKQLRGIKELSLEDPVLLLLVAQRLSLLRALERRGHAALEVLQAGSDLTLNEALMAQLLSAFEAARAGSPGLERHRVKLLEAMAKTAEPAPS